MGGYVASTRKLLKIHQNGGESTSDYFLLSTHLCFLQQGNDFI